MESLEFALILLACVIASSLLVQIIHRFSLPLVQIAVGCVVALIIPTVNDIHIEPDLFLVLFIAPLLFNEARNINARELWNNKGAIVSLAIGLVLITTLACGFVLNFFVPAIPLAAAFACAAALAPTDAAAVGALSSSVSLTKRQNMVLSGESLINDASGVIAFQFAIAAAVSGTFSIAEAGTDFLWLFFGGIGIGIALGFAGKLSVHFLRNAGYESTNLYVLYEVFSPFFVYLIARWLGASGILAVVAAGIVMAEHRTRLTSTTAARHELVSNGFWGIIVFLINSIVFVLLGMQLPQAFAPAIADSYSAFYLICIVLLLTALVTLCRFMWVFVMDLVHLATNRECDLKGRKKAAFLFKDSAIYTVAGPKGAVALSIIFTIPRFMSNGTTTFPERDLIIFLTASVILCTLLIADILLPKLSPKKQSSDNDIELKQATVKVLQGTIDELQKMLEDKKNSAYDPALRMTIAHYHIRLHHEIESMEGDRADLLEPLEAEVRRLQQKKADQIHAEYEGEDMKERTPYYSALRHIRRSVGYEGEGVNVGSRLKTLRGWFAFQWQRIKPKKMQQEQEEGVYYDACLFAIKLENTAIDHLKKTLAQGGPRASSAEVLLEEHQMAFDSLMGRINFRQDNQRDVDDLSISDTHQGLPKDMKPMFGKQLSDAGRYADEVDADALAIELEQIRSLHEHGEISLEAANELRQKVYVLQMSL